MTSTRIVAVMLDGTKHEATGVYMALADRVAFESRFGVSVSQTIRVTAAAFDESGEPRPGADASDLREEHAAFFSWRLLARGGAEVGTFEEFLEGAQSIQIERLDGPVDPTAPTPGLT